VRETELKSVVPDEAGCTRRLAAAGARLVFEGAIEDRRFDTRTMALRATDHVLRLRVERDANGERARLDWKGPASFEEGYKHREEIGVGVADAAALVMVLDRLGYVVTREIDRQVTTFDLTGATVRFERYPRMDTLVEVEGTPEAIERAIAVLALPRAGFTTDRLAAFVARYEARTGERAAVCEREARGDYRYSVDDA
jgi:predicted adenylyl cyclase CyaB